MEITKPLKAHDVMKLDTITKSNRLYPKATVEKLIEELDGNVDIAYFYEETEPTYNFYDYPMDGWRKKAITLGYGKMYINLNGEVCVDGTVCLNPLDGEDAYMAICCNVDCEVAHMYGKDVEVVNYIDPKNFVVILSHASQFVDLPNVVFGDVEVNNEG